MAVVCQFLQFLFSLSRLLLKGTGEGRGSVYLPTGAGVFCLAHFSLLPGVGAAGKGKASTGVLLDHLRRTRFSSCRGRWAVISLVNSWVTPCVLLPSTSRPEVTLFATPLDRPS